MKIDFRELGIEKAFADMLKKSFTKEVKQYLRENAEIIGNDYCQVVKDNYSKDTYSKDGKTIKLDTSEIIANYCKENGIEIIKETKENYSIELVATAKAQKEAEKMLRKIAESNDNKTLAKSANIILEKAASKK